MLILLILIKMGLLMMQILNYFYQDRNILILNYLIKKENNTLNKLKVC